VHDCAVEVTAVGEACGGDGRERQLLGNFKPRLLEVKSQVAVEGVERLFIPVPIEVFNLELAACIEQPGPAVWITAPWANNLRFIAIVEATAAIGTCIHLALLPFGSRRLRQMSFCWVRTQKFEQHRHGFQDANRSTSVRRRRSATDEEIQMERDDLRTGNIRSKEWNPQQCHSGREGAKPGKISGAPRGIVQPIDVLKGTTFLFQLRLHSPHVIRPRQKSARCRGHEESLDSQCPLRHRYDHTIRRLGQERLGRIDHGQEIRGLESTVQSQSLMVIDLKTAGLWPDVEKDKQKLLLSDRISAQQRIDASWLAESITCLLWRSR
jgi:hypothetical protein